MEAVSLGPQDLEAVFNVLKSSLSQDSTTRNQGEATLRSLELSPGFSSCLTEIINRQEADHSVRWLAAVHLKNSINKYWRFRSTPGSLSEDEKSHLRDRILKLMEEEDSQIAIQLAVVISKMARFDYPKSWPQLFTELVSRLPPPTSAENIQSNTVVAIPRRTILVLHHVLKELSSKRLASDQKCFEQLTSQIIQHIWSMWLADTTAITAILPSSSLSTNMQPSILLVLERWLLELKVLSRLLLFGYSSDSKTLEPVAVVTQAVNPLLQALAAMSRCLAAQQQQRAINHSRMQFRIMAERGIVKLLKILRKLVDTHPWSVFQSGALIPALEFCCSEILQQDNNNNGTGSSAGKTSSSLISEDHTKEALMFIITTLNSKSYKGSSVTLALGSAARTQLDTLKSAASQVKPLLEQFLSANNNRERLCYTLVMHYLPLKKSELEDWEDSPESFYHEKDYHSTTWEDSVRGCAEHTYLALFESSSEAVGPVIIELIKQVEVAYPVGSSSSSSSTHHHDHYLEVESMRNIPIEAIQKAAVYHAAAVGAYELHDHIDFSPWLHSSLLPEITSNNNKKICKPIKQAALRVVSYWVSRLTASDRSTVYAAVLHAMQDPDPVISLSAVSTLHALVEDWEFNEEGFAPYISPVFSALASMLSTLTELDSQSQVFAVLNALMSRLNDSVKPHAPGLLALLPAVWKAAEGQSLLRIQVLVALQRLVVLLGPESTMTHNLVVPLLQQYLSSNNNKNSSSSSSTDDDEAMNLREDVLHLWLIALRCAADPVPGLLAEPFPYLVNMLQSSTEYVSFGMRITFSAVLLGNGPFLDTCGQGLVQMLTTLITTVNERGVATILPVVDVVLQSFPDQGPHLLGPVLVCLLKDIKKYNNSAIAGHIIGIYSRVLLQNTGAFLSIFSLLAADQQQQQQQQVSSSEELLLLQYIDQWLDKIDSIPQASGRKLSALALCVLITLPIGPGLLHRLGAILGVISGIWFELESEGVDELMMEFYNIAPRDHELAALVESEDAEMEGKRRKALGRVDPVRQVGLGVFVREQFNKARGVHGEGFDVVLNGMDSALSGQIRTMLGM